MSKFFGPSPLQDAPAVRFIFSNTKMAWLWLVVRVYVGYTWLSASLHKLSSPAWMQTGDAIKGYWENAVRIPEAPAPAPIYYGWYRSFLQSLLDSGAQVWFGKLIAIGEFLVGICLILGLFVGVAAFFGALMNLNFMLAGSLASGPVLLVLEILLVIAWKIAGHFGLNYFIHKRFGTLWQPAARKRIPAQS